MVSLKNKEYALNVLLIANIVIKKDNVHGVDGEKVEATKHLHVVVKKVIFLN